MSAIEGAIVLDNIARMHEAKNKGKIVKKEQNEIIDFEQKADQYINEFGAKSQAEVDVIKDAVRVFSIYKLGGLYANSMYSQTVQGCRKFIQQCFRLKACYPDIKLTPDDVFTGTCEVKGTPMVYGKLAVKIGTSHASFSRTQTTEEKQGGKVKWTLTVFGLMKNGQEYEAFKGSFETADLTTAGQEAAYSKFLRRSLVKAFPDKFAYGYCEPSDADVFDEKTTEQPKPKESIAEITKRKALEDLKKEKEQKEQKIKEAEQVADQADATEQQQPAQAETVADKPVEESWLSKHCKHIDAHANDESYLYKLLEKYEALPAKSERYSEDDRKKVIDKLRTELIIAHEREDKKAKTNEKEGMF